MYLEISARQTGKTTRLINQIFADKDQFDIQILMGMNKKSLDLIKTQLKNNNKIKICLTFESFKEITKQLTEKPLTAKLYVDQFMWSNIFMDNFKQILNTQKYLLINGYFSSSLNTNYMLSLFELQSLNNGNIYSMNVSSKHLL